MPTGIYDRAKAKPRNPHSEITKKKISIAHKGKKLSKEHKRKMGLSRKGIIPKSAFKKGHKVNLGRKYSLEYRKRLSEIHKNSIKHIKANKKFKILNKGKHNSSATEFKKGLIPWNKGKKVLQITGKNHPNWKGGRTVNCFGYRQIYQPNHSQATYSGYILEHRFVVEKYLKRILTPEEVVHHINGNTLDNRLENLIVFVSQKMHKRFEYKKKVNKKYISFNGYQNTN